MAISAKLSNCWKPLRALDTTFTRKRVNRTSRNGVGIVKILEIGQSAAKSYVIKHDMERVQRLNGSSGIFILVRYSLLSHESVSIIGFGFPSPLKRKTLYVWSKNTKIQKTFIQKLFKKK